jgi:DNA-binding transcriptional ArsR family regulator
VSFSLLDKTNLYISFGVCIGDFTKLSSTIDMMSPSVVEYHLSSMIVNYDEYGNDINFNEYIQVGDYTIYQSITGDLYLKNIKKESSEDMYETGSLF